MRRHEDGIDDVTSGQRDHNVALCHALYLLGDRHALPSILRDLCAEFAIQHGGECASVVYEGTIVGHGHVLLYD